MELGNKKIWKKGENHGETGLTQALCGDTMHAEPNKEYPLGVLAQLRRLREALGT